MRVSDYSTGTQQGGTLGPYVGRSILNTKINLLLYNHSVFPKVSNAYFIFLM